MKKIALITGAARGIGKGIALALGKEGYCVALNYHSSEHEAREVQSALGAIGTEGMLVKADVKNRQQVHEMVEEVISKWGSIAVLVNNAGIYERRTFDELDEKTWEETLAVNMTGIFHCCKEVVPSMKERGSGVIINIASQLAFMASTRGAHYTASKAGVIGFTRSLAAELAPEGIRVNAVAPGMIDHTAILDIYDDEEKKRRAGTIPLQRLGTPEDIGNAVAFLCSDRASYITGETLHVNGGFLIR